jgi:hypothetical protein
MAGYKDCHVAIFSCQGTTPSLWKQWKIEGIFKLHEIGNGLENGLNFPFVNGPYAVGQDGGVPSALDILDLLLPREKPFPRLMADLMETFERRTEG